jgi:hypothetical protein
MSRIALALALVAAAPARAADAPAPPPDDLDARHRVGVQLGGSAFVQVVYRLRLLGHSYLEVGGGGAPEGTLNASLGLVVAHSTGTRFFPYAAAGVGMGTTTSAPGMEKNAAGASCGLDATAGCPWSSRAVGFFYARAGVGAVVDASRHLSLHLDVGTWVGEKAVTSDDGRGTRTSATTRITWPMVGVAGYYSF